MRIKLETRGLTKRYGDSLALAPTDLQVCDGEFLTLLGPSGSGKTTLLQMVSGLIEPSGGQLFIDGRDATHLLAGQRGIGLVFQSYALFPHLTVAENVAYPLRMRRIASSETTKRVREALSMVKMDTFADRHPRELSGGQQQRVALARCFVYKPSVILLDEPLGALDKNLREHMQLEIRSLHRGLGATFIYVTHDQEEALAMSDRICLMNQARVEQIGAPNELYDKPVSRFAAAFLGHSNILDGHVHGKYMQWRNLQLPLPAMSEAASGSASLLVRPESAALAPVDTSFLQGQVVETVFTGADLRVIVQIEPNVRFTVRTPRIGKPDLGAMVGITWNPADTILLHQ